MSLKPKAKELLLQVRAAILEEPARIRMAWWRIDREKQESLVRLGDHAALPACGTVGCIAGWVVELGYKQPKRIKRVNAAAYRLLDWRPYRILPLFHTQDWPSDLSVRVRALAVTGTPEYAAVVAAAIDRWIVADGDPERFQAS